MKQSSKIYAAVKKTEYQKGKLMNTLIINELKALKISKMLFMAFGAPLIFMMIYIWSLQFRGFIPPLFCFLLLSLSVLAPLEITALLRENKKEYGKIGIKCALSYHQELHKGKALLIVLILICIAGIASKFVGALEDSLVMPYVSKYVPDYFIAKNYLGQLEQYPKSVILITAFLFLIANSLVLPITEELYFNGYMLPRLQRFKKLAPVIVTIVFSLYHFWSPWENMRRITGCLPYVYMVQKTKNIYIGIAVHCLCNFISSIEILLIVFKSIG